MLNSKSNRVWVACVGFVACSILASGALVPAGAQDKRITQLAGVDETNMGAYRALAQLSFQAFQRGDMPAAAELARILERTWDAAEGGGADRSLIKRNKDLYVRLDSAMDAFIKPILNYAVKPPDATAVQMAYNTYLDKLKQAD